MFPINLRRSFFSGAAQRSVCVPTTSVPSKAGAGAEFHVIGRHVHTCTLRTPPSTTERPSPGQPENTHERNEMELLVSLLRAVEYRVVVLVVLVVGVVQKNCLLPA